MVIKMETPPLYKTVKKYNAVARKRISIVGVMLNIVLYAAFFSICTYFAVYKITDKSVLGYITSVPFFVFIAVRLYFFAKRDYVSKLHVEVKRWKKERIYNALMNMDEYSYTALCLEYIKRKYGVCNMKFCVNCWKNGRDVLVMERTPHTESRDISFINSMNAQGVVYIVTDKDIGKLPRCNLCIIDINDIGEMFEELITDTTPPTKSRRKINIFNADTLKLCIKLSALFGVMSIIVREWVIWFTVLSSLFGCVGLCITVSLINSAISSKSNAKM